MTSTRPTAVGTIAAGGEVITVAGLITALNFYPPDMPVVVAVDGPDPDVCSPLDWIDAMWYGPDSPNHGRAYNPRYDPTDETGEVPGAVRVLVLGQRGVPDDARAEEM